MTTCHGRLEIELVGDVTVVTFLDENIYWQALGQNIELIAGHLLDLIEDSKSSILLDFGQVDFWDEYMVGKLVSFHRAVKKVGAKLLMCNIRDDFFDKLDAMRLSLFFGLTRGLDRSGALSEFL